MFWDIRRIESNSLPGLATLNPLDPDFNQERRSWLLNASAAPSAPIDRVTLAIRVRPIALSTLDDLVQSGHLDTEVAEAVPVFTLRPNRCPDDTLLEEYPELLAQNETCESTADDEYTLTWDRARATSGNPTYRQTTLDGAPAHCLAHPTFLPPR
jgi:hypothetical protein